MTTRKQQRDIELSLSTMTRRSSSDNDFVTVDMPSENDVGPMDVEMGGSIAAQDVQPDGSISISDGGGGESESHRQRSLLKTLWSEATSTTDLPAPVNHQLHHRRGTTTNKDNRSGSAGGNNNVRSRGSRESPSKTPSKFRHTQRYRVSRGAKIAKRVWLAAFAAFAASVLIAVHVFLYRVFMRSGGTDNNGNGNGIDRSKGAFLEVTKHGMPILGVEDQEVKMTLAEAHSHPLSAIDVHSIDREKYTIRMNTWQRNEQLLLSVNHHAKCEGVKEIQIIWCDVNNEPPHEILHHKSGKVKIEKHAINSLNERFKVLMDTPTLGILSLDDDVLRPCVALDAAFVRWTRHPERMVGFDVRSHVVVEDDNNEGKGKSIWKYGYMSTTESSNQYSMTLPRASFIHRDYLDLYTMALPRPIYTYVAKNLECEDIAMSFLVSSLTGGKPPLIADYWAVKSMVKLYSEKKISGGTEHKSTRDNCVNNFAELLGLKENGEWPLQTAKLVHRDQFFGYGAEPEEWSSIDLASVPSPRLQDVIEEMQELKEASGEERMSWLVQQKAETMIDAKKTGMVEKTEEWKERWRKG